MTQLSAEFLNQLLCPCCKGRLTYNQKDAQLICTFERLTFNQIDGIFQLRPEDAIPYQTEDN